MRVLSSVQLRQMGFVAGLVLAISVVLPCQASPIVDIAAFNGSNGAIPFGQTILDAQGNLWGIAAVGGKGAHGDIWELAKGSATITDVMDLNAEIDGRSMAFCGLAIDRKGNPWGTVSEGGNNDQGFVWTAHKGDAINSSIYDAANFNMTNGANPIGNLAVDSDGSIWGVAQNGGPGGLGAVWKITSNQAKLVVVAGFAYNNGANPLGLTIDSDGNVWGMANPSGVSTVPCVIWEIKKDRSQLEDVAELPSDNKHSLGDFTFDSAGNIWGTANPVSQNQQAAGYVWEVKKTSNKILFVAKLPQKVYGDIGIDAGGNLFGTTLKGGAYNAGNVWELKKGSTTVVDIADFDGTNGTQPYTGLVVDAHGNLFGAAASGGPNKQGVVWEVKNATAQ